LLQKLKSYCREAMTSPNHGAGSVLRRIMPFKDLEAYRIGTWRHGQLARVQVTDILPGIKDVNVTLVNLFQRKIGLSVDAAELMILCAIERCIGAKKVVEIGTYDGNTALNLAANIAEGGRVTTIDLPPDWDRKFVYDVPNSHWNVTDRNRIGVQYRGTQYENRIRQVLGDSAGLDWSVLDPPFDMAFVDGCHFYDYVKKDTENALRCLRPGGVIVGHDYGDMTDVSRAVDEAAKGFTAYAIRGTRLAIGWNGQAPQRAFP